MNNIADGNYTLPTDITAEQSVLGAMLIDKAALDIGCSSLKKEDFSRDCHQELFLSILAMMEDGTPVDMITITAYLNNNQNLEKAGGLSYIMALFDTLPSAANIIHYLKIVKDKSICRQIIHANLRGIAIALGEVEDINQTIAEAQDELLAIKIESSTERRLDTLVKASKARAFERRDILVKHPGTIFGIRTGYKMLDYLTCGLQPGEMSIIAARPSAGKSVLGMNLLGNAGKLGIQGHLFSIEMTGAQVADRELASGSLVDSSRLKRGTITSSDAWAIEHFADHYGNTGVVPIIDDAGELTASKARSLIRKSNHQYGTQLFVIDYLQLMHNGDKRNEKRNLEIGDICKTLKDTAGELNVHVCALAQISRLIESTKDKRPMLSHLKDSGNIEQTADVIVFIHRSGYYEPKKQLSDFSMPDTEIAEIIVAKNRNGMTGMVKLGWQPSLYRFVDIASEWSEDQEQIDFEGDPEQISDYELFNQ